MPIYEYQCCSCENNFEKLVFGRDEVVCPSCGGAVEKMMSCCNFKSGAGDFNPTSSSGKSGCSTCSSSSCASCN
ncbi:MAG: zinc ribbon domain-containing protein [Desulfomonile sp.]|nr:zinc ribbon domain-containing protein [Deltaproteobacteria bacterium]